MKERGKTELNIDLCNPPANPAATNCLPDWCYKCPPIPTRKSCGKVPRFHIPEDCLPRVIKEPPRPPLEPVGAFSYRPDKKISLTDEEREKICRPEMTPRRITDWPRDCPKVEDDPKQLAPRFQQLDPLECGCPPPRKARLRQDLCRREAGRLKWQAPFIPVLNTLGLDPKEPRDLAPPSSKDGTYTSPACMAGFFGNVSIPEANPCHVSEEEKERLYHEMVYTTTAQRMNNDIPFTPNVRLPLTTTLEERADMVKYRPKKFAPVSHFWQLVPSIWDRPQLRQQVDHVVGDRDTTPKINTIFPSMQMLLNNRRIMPPCPVAPSCFVCQEELPLKKYECAVVCPHHIKKTDGEAYIITAKETKINDQSGKSLH